MKIKTIFSTALCAGSLSLSLATSRAQTTANWIDTAADHNWNTAANWDAGVPAEGTNAVIGGYTVNYNTPMAATSFATLSLGGALTVNTNGFNINPGLTSVVPLTVSSGGSLAVNTNGMLTVANAGATTFAAGSVVTNNGTMFFTNAGAITLPNAATAVNVLTINPGSGFTMTNSITTGGMNVGASSPSAGAIVTINGGTVTLDKLLTVAGVGSRFYIKGGTLNCLGNSRINDTSTDGAERIDVGNGAVANLGNFSVFRSTSAGGLVVTNAVVNATDIQIGTGNSQAFATIGPGGIVTNTGVFNISDNTNAASSSDRRSQFLVRGGTVVSTGAGGIILANQGNYQTAVTVANANIGGVLDISAGSLTAEKITLIKDATITNAYARLNLSGGIIYLGSGGLVANVGPVKTAFNIAITGGTLAAKADWASYAIAAMPLTGTLTVQAADAVGTPHNIIFSNILSGSSAVLAKTGGGTLTLLATNTYTGNTLVNAGTLALGANGSIASAQISLASGATLDISSVTGGFTNASGRTLAGFGVVTGAVTFVSGAIINPGVTGTNGALSFSNSVTEIGNTSGGVINHFDLSSNPLGVSSNDFVFVVGDLNVSGTNSIQIGGTPTSGTSYALIQYGGNFNGGLTNFVLSGAVGVLSNDAVNKVIYLNTLNTLRGPASTVWVGNPLNANWDLSVSTNWLNAGALDYFVQGDTVRFDATGAANATVTVVGSVAPTAITVDATANYAFTGAGSIDGSGGLLKTNSGTLTILTVNNYAGVTAITGGKLSVATLANGGVASSIGSAPNSQANLFIDNATFEYLGGNISSDRGLTLGTNGGTLSVTNATKTLTLSGYLTGLGALTKTGNGQITLTGGNDYSGGTIINAGSLRANPATGIGTNILTLNGVTSNAATFVFSGDSQVLSNTPNIIGTNNFITTGGNDTVGKVTGSGTVILEQSAANQLLTLQAIDSTAFTGTFVADTLSQLRFFPTAGTTLNASNAVFDLGAGTNVLYNRDGGNYSLGALAGGPNTQLRGSQNSGSAATTYTIGGRNSDSAFAGAIKTGAGGTGAKVNLVKVGTGALTLSGANTYNGTTVINGGTLALSGAGSISSTPTISVFTNTVLDVSARTDGTITLSSGQTLQGSGTVRGSLTAQSGSIINVGDDLGLPEPMSVTNVLTLQSGSTLNMDVDHYQYAGGATNDTIQGLAQINYGGNLNLNVISVETNSVFKLFSATNYSGAFDSITPATPASLSGGPWAWDTSKLTVDGTLRVAMAKLVISSFVTSGSDIILNATGGTPFGTVNVLSTTNLTQPILQWTTVTSGSFDGSGNFNYTISGALNSGLPQDFFILQTQ